MCGRLRGRAGGGSGSRVVVMARDQEVGAVLSGPTRADVAKAGGSGF